MDWVTYMANALQLTEEPSSEHEADITGAVINMTK